MITTKEKCKKQLQKQLSKIRVDILDAKFNQKKLDKLYNEIFVLSQFVDKCVVVDKEALKQYVINHTFETKNRFARELGFEQYGFKYAISFNIKENESVPVGFAKNQVAEKLIAELENVGGNEE